MPGLETGTRIRITASNGFEYLAKSVYTQAHCKDKKMTDPEQLALDIKRIYKSQQTGM